jgi:hypothetical protein
MITPAKSVMQFAESDYQEMKSMDFRRPCTNQATRNNYMGLKEASNRKLCHS